MILILLRHCLGLVFLAIGSAFLLSSCFPSMETQEPESGELSVSRTITDSKGRSLKVTIIGRSGDSVTFVRESDRETFTIPVTNLSQEDQSFVARLPMAAPPPVKKESSDDELANASGPLGFALDRRNEILKKLDLIAEEIPKFSKAPSKVNSLNRERDKLTLELESVNSEIRLLKGK